MPAVYYLCCWTGESGGIKVLYDHVRLLRTLGVAAHLASYGAFERAGWFAHDPRDVPGCSDLLRRLLPEDVVVLPEFCMRDRELAGARCRQLVLVQNTKLVTGALDDLRYEGLIASSRPLAAWVRERGRPGGPVHLVPGMLEEEWIFPSRAPPAGRLRVLVIDRLDKHQGEPERVYAELLRHERLAVTYVRPRMPRDAFVQLFRHHDVYVHLGYPEGFPVSVLEAFGAGCLVVGFAGLGGLEFMRGGKNCFLVADGDWEAAARRVLALETMPRAAWAAMLAAARRTARRCGEARTRRGLARLARALRRAPGQASPFSWLTPWKA
ncbi:MAG: glycosyltransferase [Planctomycetes bacterium]|nr:glycosyltransferase [Planctomycetota bacterium]